MDPQIQLKHGASPGSIHIKNKLGLRDEGIDQLNFHSAQLGYIQSQGAKQKLVESSKLVPDEILKTGTRRNPQNAAFQLNHTTSRCSLDWFLKSTAGHPVATYKTRRLTKSNDAVTHASITTRNCSSSRNTIPPATGSSILRLVILSRAQRLPDATQAQQLLFHFHQLQATVTIKFQSYQSLATALLIQYLEEFDNS
ncbi:hypothetical protein F511_15456 [Dorcoceras hygrometricum]|uniref:Uncharacterized protein n=1 Tax=Dorcoceras hygrometricum TaxID=472368 RepID=A0A2Z7CXL7_9LAMI|nr:hypothetical protein F511_15456 [Dorcoceras hygrometricum]